MPISSASLVHQLNGEPASGTLVETGITGVAPASTASAEQLCFFEGRRADVNAIENSGAGLIFLPNAWREHVQAQARIAYFKDPAVAFIKAQHLIPELITPKEYPPANIANDAQVHTSAVIEEGARVGNGCVIGANAYIGKGVILGEGCVIDANVVLYEGVQMGAQCRVMANTSIGSDGFGWRVDEGRWLQFPQIGGVVIGDDVCIGANITIDCGAMGPTRIGNGVRLDNQIHIAHNCEIGDYTAIAGCTGMAGSTKIGKWCRIGGSTNILGHITIGDYCNIHGATFVSKDMDSGTKLSSVIPGKEPRQWARSLGYINRLEDLFTRVKLLEKNK